MCLYDVERWSAGQLNAALTHSVHDYVISIRSYCCWVCKGTNAHSFASSRGLFTVLCCLENPFRRDSVGADVAKRVNGGPQDDTSAVDVTLLSLRTLEMR